jgi:predicted lipoprotein with Yx(FWY)xxD motif
MRARKFVPAVLLAALLVCGVAFALTVKSLGTGKAKVSGKNQTVVVDNRGVTVYEVGGESLAKLECETRACLNVWIPLSVPSATTKVAATKGVPGTVGVFHRVKGHLYQVMLDKHPLYYYSGDKGHKGSAKGQGLKLQGNETWHVVSASGS